MFFLWMSKECSKNVMSSWLSSTRKVKWLLVWRMYLLQSFPRQISMWIPELCITPWALVTSGAQQTIWTTWCIQEGGVSSHPRALNGTFPTLVQPKKWTYPGIRHGVWVWFYKFVHFLWSSPFCHSCICTYPVKQIYFIWIGC